MLSFITDQDAAVVREQLEKDLHSAKVQLRDRRAGTADATEGGNMGTEEEENSTEVRMNCIIAKRKRLSILHMYM